MYCDPADPESIAEGMARILSDPALRERLVQQGTARLEQFTWERTAERICGIFEKSL